MDNTMSNPLTDGVIIVYEIIPQDCITVPHPSRKFNDKEPGNEYARRESREDKNPPAWPAGWIN
jgi:hypothetical protein